MMNGITVTILATRALLIILISALISDKRLTRWVSRVFGSGLMIIVFMLV